MEAGVTDVIETAALGTASLQVEADDLDPVSWSGSLVLLPGDHRAFSLGGGT